MAEPSRGGIYGIWKSLFPDPDTQPRKKIIKPKTPEPQEEGFVSLYEIGTCGSRLKRSFPAADLITILRIINLKKEDGPFHSILTRLDSDEDPRNRSIIFGQMKGKGVLSKDMIWAFDVLMKSSNPAYELPKMMLKKLNAFEPEGQMKFAEEEPPKKPQTKKVYPGRSLLQKSPEERNTLWHFPIFLILVHQNHRAYTQKEPTKIKRQLSLTSLALLLNKTSQKGKVSFPSSF